MQSEIYNAVNKLLGSLNVPAEIRASNESGDADKLWCALQQSGFLDVLVPEAEGGAGLGWAQAWEVLFAAGRYGLPMPVGATMFGRALLASLGQQAPDTALTASGFVQQGEQGSLVARDLPAAKLAVHALVQDQDTAYLLSI